MNEINAWLYSRLQGGSALTALLSGTTAIYNLQAPDNIALPYVVYSLQGGGDENQTRGSRMKSNLYYVRAYASNPTQAGSIDAEIDARLHQAQATVSGWNHIWVMREQDIELVETDIAREKTYSSGGLYRVRITKVT